MTNSWTILVIVKDFLLFEKKEQKKLDKTWYFSGNFSALWLCTLSTCKSCNTFISELPFNYYTIFDCLTWHTDCNKLYLTFQIVYYYFFPSLGKQNKSQLTFKKLFVFNFICYMRPYIEPVNFILKTMYICNFFVNKYYFC